jgi:hypothetical protein
MTHTAQDGKLSITDVPPSHWQGHIQPRTVNKLLMLSGLPGEPAGAIPSRSTRCREDDQERNDWAQWDERTNDRPHRPQSEHCSLADPACVLTDCSYSPFSSCSTDEPSNGIGEEQGNYGAECNRRHDEQRLK